MKLDDYGRTIIRNIYFDTDTYRLIRRSLEKPVYKEKLRIRSYKPVQTKDPVFGKLRKNINLSFTSGDFSFRRRMLWKVFRQENRYRYIHKSEMKFSTFVITMKILRTSVFLSYEREAYYSLDGSDFRVTFDENILYRRNDFSLGSEVMEFPCWVKTRRSWK